MLWENTIENLEACVYGVEEHNAKAETLAKLMILTAAKAENWRPKVTNVVSEYGKWEWEIKEIMWIFTKPDEKFYCDSVNNQTPV